MTTKSIKNHSYALKEIQLMINDGRADDGWVTCVIAGVWVQAQVYNEPSQYGINGGRVSKLCICKSAISDPYKDFSEQMQYEYNRELISDDTEAGLVDVVVAALEKLEPVEG